MKKGSKIFISYSHQDFACAAGIARHLARKGFDIWIDSEQLILGKEWAVDIDRALDESNAVIALLSANSVRRKEVLREISIAMNRMTNEIDKDSGFNLYFVVMGYLHPSWFSD